MQIELCDEDIFHLKTLINDKDIMKIAFDKQDVWPFTIQEILRLVAQNKQCEHDNTAQVIVCLDCGEELSSST